MTELLPACMASCVHPVLGSSSDLWVMHDCLQGIWGGQLGLAAEPGFLQPAHLAVWLHACVTTCMRGHMPAQACLIVAGVMGGERC